MKKQIENIKRNWKTEGKKAAFVILGFVTGQAIAKQMENLAAKYPDYQSYIKIGSPIAVGVGGWLFSNMTESNNTDLKFIGYGLQASGAYEGIKLTPIAKDFLSGVEDNISGTYYMENEKPMLELGDFGINALPVKSLDMENAPNVKLDLPDLGLIELDGVKDESISGNDLGYDPDRFEGIL